MRKALFALALFALLGGAAPATANVWGVPDVAPGATLLLPYFELDLDNPAGVTTLFSINNASATAILTHVVFWSDWSWHTLDFNVYLTGYDVVTINIRDVFDGNLPVTASVGQDPGDVISNQGIFSQDINFASCNGTLPYVNPSLPPFNLDLIRLGHTGQPVPDLGNRCVGEDHGDNIARGYVTVDTVNSCSLDFPATPGYFATTATFQNVIWGDFFIVDVFNNFAFGDALVHLQASASVGTGVFGDPLAEVPNDTGYTFYSRYVGNSGADYREPLGTIWATRFLNGGAFDGGTDLITWRDSTANEQPANGFSCAGGPSWAPLSQRQIVIFDEFENPVVPEGCTISPCPDEEGLTPFPLETQRVHIGGPDMPVPFDFGWIYFDLYFPGDDVVSGDVDPGQDGRNTQSYMLTSHSAKGRFQVGYPATMLRLATQFPPLSCVGGSC